MADERALKPEPGFQFDGVCFIAVVSCGRVRALGRAPAHGDHSLQRVRLLLEQDALSDLVVGELRTRSQVKSRARKDNRRNSIRPTANCFLHCSV